MCPIPVKGESAIECPAVTCIVVGNKHPRDVYPNAYPYIEARFHVHCVDDPPEPSIPYMFLKHSPVKQ